MSVFEECFLFLRAHDGGVEDLARMKAAGFGGVFCNIGDASTPAHWSTVRQRAQAEGMFCGPWLRTADADNNFDPDRLDRLVDVADQWESPFIVNSESEINNSGYAITREIADAVGDREAAVSVLPIPMATVHYTPIGHLPVLPQVFPPDQGGVAYDPSEIRSMWHSYGVRCVYMTYATYGGMRPEAYKLQAPYSLYTGDDCGYDYAAWSPTSTGWEGCADAPVPPTPPDGGDMEKIGDQDGITAAMNRLRSLDAAGTLLVFDEAAGKWPDISTLPPDKGKWKAYDKLQRTLQILKDDHDEAIVFDVAD